MQWYFGSRFSTWGDTQKCLGIHHIMSKPPATSRIAGHNRYSLLVTYQFHSTRTMLPWIVDHSGRSASSRFGRLILYSLIAGHACGPADHWGEVRSTRLAFLRKSFEFLLIGKALPVRSQSKAQEEGGKSLMIGGYLRGVILFLNDLICILSSSQKVVRRRSRRLP